MINRIGMLCLLVSLWLLVPVNAAFAQEEWPRFLGNNGDGVSAQVGLVDEVTADSVKEAWRVPGGVGMSAIAVKGDVAITMWNTATQQVLVALNAKTGETIWSTPIATEYQNGQGDGPRATPTIDGDSVYAFTSDGVLARVDLSTGHLDWRIDAMKLTGAKAAEYGLSSSPLVTAQNVIVHVGADRGSVAAFSCDDGALAWMAGSGAAGYSSPTLLTIDGQPQIVSFVASGVVGIDPTSGKELWDYDFETPYDCNTASPVLAGNRVFISAGENHGCVLLDVQKTDDGYRVTEKWASVDVKSVMRNEWQTSVIDGDHLFGFDNVGSAGPTTHLSCIKVDSGEVVWRKTRFGKGNLVLADGKLWITTMAGELVAVKADPQSFQELGRVQLFGKTRQSLSIANGHGFIRDDADIVCIDLRQK